MSFWCSIYSRSFRLPSSWQLLARGKFDLTLTNQVITKCLNKWDFHILKFNFPWKHGMASLLTVVGPREIWLESQFIEVEAANMRLLHKISNQITFLCLWCWCDVHVFKNKVNTNFLRQRPKALHNCNSYPPMFEENKASSRIYSYNHF